MAQETGSLSNQALAQKRTAWAYERTQIAGGGSAITVILAEGCPDWVVGLLAGVFIVVGFTVMLGGLQRYQHLARRLSVENDFAGVPIRLVVVMTIALQVATLIVLTLFLLR